MRRSEKAAEAEAGVCAEAGSEALPLPSDREEASTVLRRGVAGSCLSW